jgi:serine/threonine-protein kinase
MSGIEFDETQGSFPGYATLTESRAWTSPMAAVNPAMIEAISVRYTEGALLGVGGMGKVVLARDEHLGRDVAVKQLRDDREVAPDERARFLREARVQAQLEHPSIVPIYDLEQQPGGAAFFTMRRVLGRTLHAILEELRAGTTPPRYSQRELLAAFATACLAVDYAHSRGVIHRDLKPANLMLGDFGEVYVLDWGLARLLHEDAAAKLGAPPSSRLSTPGAIMGTPLYMSPEQLLDPAVGPESDVFALGAILFEILTLVTARDPKAVTAAVNARMSVRAPDRDVAPELEAICVRALATGPAQRFPSARALHAAVARYLDGDRDREQRRALASTHAAAAVAALAHGGEPGADYEAARGEAMRDLVRALSLDPTNREHVTTLATIMQTLPSTVPPEVEQELRASEQGIVRQGARDSIIGMGAWFLFLPVVYALGVVHAYMIWLILVPVGLAIVFSIRVLKMSFARPVDQYFVLICSMLGMVMVSRMFGPLVLGPTLIATYAITLQVHPRRSIGLLMLGVATLAMIAPMMLELAGVLPSSYVYDHGRMVILPQLIELGQGGSIAVLLGASVLSLVAPAVFVGQVRDRLNQAERRLLLQAWHFRRLGER